MQSQHLQSQNQPEFQSQRLQSQNQPEMQSQGYSQSSGSGTHQLNPQQEKLISHPQEFQYIEKGVYTKEQTGTVQKDAQPEIRRDLPSQIVQEGEQISQQALHGKQHQYSAQGTSQQGLLGKEQQYAQNLGGTTGISQKEQQYSKDLSGGSSLSKDVQIEKEKLQQGEKRLQQGHTGYSAQ